MSIIPHESNGFIIPQRSEDGYVNLTKMVKACNEDAEQSRQVNHYLSNKDTKAFLEALSTDTGNPVSTLISVRKGGVQLEQGTWAHPQVAVHCAYWCSPQFAVLVTKRVFDWMMTGKTPEIEQPPQTDQPILESPPQIEPPTIETAEPIREIEPQATHPELEPASEEIFHPALQFFTDLIALGEQLGGFDDQQKAAIRLQLIKTAQFVKVSELVGLNEPMREAEQLSYTIAERAAILGHRLNASQSSSAGKMAAAIYRQKHEKNPPQRSAPYNGGIAYLNVYGGRDLQIADLAIQTIVERGY